MARSKKSITKEPAKTGRPSKYRPEYARQVRKLALVGMTDVQIADVFEIAPSTLALWKRREPLFSEALRSGKADADAKVAAALYRRALGFKHKTEKVFQFRGSIVRADVVERFAPDTTACIYWLKNRQPEMWRDAGRGAMAGEGKPGGTGMVLNVHVDADTLAIAGMTV